MRAGKIEMEEEEEERAEDREAVEISFEQAYRFFLLVAQHRNPQFLLDGVGLLTLWVVPATE